VDRTREMYIALATEWVQRLVKGGVLVVAVILAMMPILSLRQGTAVRGPPRDGCVTRGAKTRDG